MRRSFSLERARGAAAKSSGVAGRARPGCGGRAPRWCSPRVPARSAPAATACGARVGPRGAATRHQITARAAARAARRHGVGCARPLGLNRQPPLWARRAQPRLRMQAATQLCVRPARSPLFQSPATTPQCVHARPRDGTPSCLASDQPPQALRQQQHEPHKKGPTVITSSPDPLGSFPPAAARPAAAAPDHADHHSDQFDVIVCGGTLGLLPALALQMRGWRVAVVERRLAEGRTQEWNSSRGEMQVGVGVLCAAACLSERAASGAGAAAACASWRAPLCGALVA